MKHLHNNHKLVMAALKAVAKDVEVPFADVKKDFIAGNEDVTVLFWRFFYAENPYKTNGVDCCHTCRKFMLEFQKPLIPWSLEYALIPDRSIIH